MLSEWDVAACEFDPPPTITVRQMREIAELPVQDAVWKYALSAGASTLMRAEILLRRVEVEGVSPDISEAIITFNAERRKAAQ